MAYFKLFFAPRPLPFLTTTEKFREHKKHCVHERFALEKIFEDNAVYKVRFLNSYRMAYSLRDHSPPQKPKTKNLKLFKMLYLQNPNKLYIQFYQKKG